MRALLRYLHKLDATPSRMAQADAGCDAIAPYHVASIRSTSDLDSRIIHGLGNPPQAVLHLRATVDRLCDRGYSSTVSFIRGDRDKG